MRYIDYRARFFAVVGAPDVAKRHADARHHSSHETPPPCPAQRDRGWTTIA